MTADDLIRILAALPPEQRKLPIGQADRDYGWRAVVGVMPETRAFWSDPGAEHMEERDVLTLQAKAPEGWQG